MALALIASAGNNANTYLAKHMAELGYARPLMVASGGEGRRRMDGKEFAVVVINTPLPAIAQAIYNATGLRFYEPPFTPEKILRGLKELKGETL